MPPQHTANHFVRWTKEPDDVKTKEKFYPTLNKSKLFPKGYIVVYSGHSRMLAAGFDDYSEEWWHYTFICDAPKIYYDFPIL